MPNNEYVSCDYLINGIGFELNSIEVCCFRCHKGGGHIKIADVKNGIVDIKSLIETRNELIEQNKNGRINPQCEGCFNLKKGNWSEKPSIKYIHFNHWRYCNSKCIYCYTTEEKEQRKEKQCYKALPVLKEILKHFNFRIGGEITFAGGEPVILDEFEDIIEYLLKTNGSRKITIHSSGLKYSPVLEKAIKDNIVRIVISQDSGTEDVYKKIKNIDGFYKCWENTAKYASFQGKNDNVHSKFIIIPKINDNKREINEWINKSYNANIKSVIIDVEHNFYFLHKNNFIKMYKMFLLCRYIEKQAGEKGLNTGLYNTALYLYNKYNEPFSFAIGLVKRFASATAEYKTYLSKTFTIFSPLKKYTIYLYERYKKFIFSVKYKINFYKKYFIELFILSLPLLTGFWGQTLIGAEDVMVTAKYNINSLAAISIANSILFSVFIFGLGILSAISVILSNKLGAKRKTKKYLKSTLIFSLALSAVFTVICYSASFLIDKFSFEAELIPYIKEYIRIVSFSMFGIFIFQGIKEFLQAYEIVKFPNLLLLAAVVFNLIFDIVFIFGLGNIIPAMGSKGAAVSTLLVRSIMGLVMLLAVFKMIKLKDKTDFSYIKRILKIGCPIGAALMLEFLAFNMVTILAGRESGLLAAANSILITITSATFMIPLALSTATSIKAAYFYGAAKPKEIKRYSYAGIISGTAVMAVWSLVLAIFPENVIKIFTENPRVLNIAAPIVLIAALFQIFDGFQVIAGGILKGFKMTKAVTGCVLFGYWIIGMPIAYILVYKYDYSLKGFWIAFAAALFSIGFIEALIAKYKFKKIKEEIKAACG